MDQHLIEGYAHPILIPIPATGAPQLRAPGQRLNRGHRPGPQQSVAVHAKVDQWMAKHGMKYLQEVIYQKFTPHERAEKFFRDPERVG